MYNFITIIITILLFISFIINLMKIRKAVKKLPREKYEIWNQGGRKYIILSVALIIGWFVSIGISIKNHHMALPITLLVLDFVAIKRVDDIEKLMGSEK